MFEDHPEVAQLFNKSHQVEINGARALQPQSLAESVHVSSKHAAKLNLYILSRPASDLPSRAIGNF